MLIIKNILAGLFPVLTIIAYTNLLSPFTALAWGSLIATIFFFILLTIKNGWINNIPNTKLVLKEIFLSIFLIAIVVFGINFVALNYTSAQNVTILGLLESVTSFLILGLILKKEPISAQHLLGAFLMIIASGIILFNNQTPFNIGDILILIAIIIAPLGNMFAKKALYKVSLTYLLFLRSLFSALIFFVVAYIFESPISREVFIQSIPYLLFNGIVYLGVMRMTMYFGYKTTSVTHTISLGSLKPISAFIFAWIILNQIPTLVQTSALIPSIIGLYLLTKAKQKKPEYGEQTKHQEVLKSKTPPQCLYMD